MTLFKRNFIAALRENDPETIPESCRSTFRTDGTGKRIKIPCGAGYRQGKNKRGVVIKPGDSAKEDEVGQMHSVPPCQHLKAGANKKAISVCPGDSTTEKNGQIMSRKKPKLESRRLSCLELLQKMRWLAEG